jgi:hypothetical protein
MRIFFFSFLFVVSLLSLSSAQMIMDETFVGVPSYYVGSQDAGCGLACMVSMIASLNDTTIGTNVWEIYQGIKQELPEMDPPYPTYELTKAAVAFILSII